MRKQYSTVSFKGQIIYVGIDVHKKQWTVAVQHCGRVSETFSMDPAPEKLAEHLKRNYPDAEYRSVYEAGFSGFEAHRTLCQLGVQNIVINPADVPTSGKEREKKNVCGFCSSDRDFATGFFQIPPRDGHPCLSLTVPTDKSVSVFHRLANEHAAHTEKAPDFEKSRRRFFHIRCAS